MYFIMIILGLILFLLQFSKNKTDGDTEEGKSGSFFETISKTFRKRSTTDDYGIITETGHEMEEHKKVGNGEHMGRINAAFTNEPEKI